MVLKEEVQEKGSKRKSSRRSSRNSSRKSSRRRESDLEAFSNDFSEDDFYHQVSSYVPVTSQPISYLYYDPLIYNLDSVFVPTFFAYLSPYVEINTRSGMMTTTYPSIV